MKKSNGLSTRMRNLMNAYVGRKFNYFHGGYQFYWSIKIVALMGETGYFVTELNDGKNTWQSNASYGEIKTMVEKKGYYIEVKS